MEAKKARAELASLQSLMAEKQQLLTSVQGRITNSQACLEEQRSRLKSLEVQARLLRTDVLHLSVWESKLHQPGTTMMQRVNPGLLGAGPLGLQQSVLMRICRHKKLPKAGHSHKPRWLYCSSTCTKSSLNLRQLRPTTSKLR